MANLYDKAGLVNIPVGYQDGFLYNIKPTDNTLGFRFNRDSAATRVNKKGLIEQVSYFGPELVTNGDFATDSNWSKGTGWTISDGKAVAVLANNTYLTQNQNTVANKTYKVVYTVSDYQNGIVRFQFSGGGNTLGTDVNANGTYTEYITSTLNHTTYRFKAKSDDGGFTGSIDNVSVTEVLGDKPRIDYTDSLTSPSFLLEPQSTNLVLNSENFSAWSVSSNAILTYESDVISPDGTSGVYRLNLPATSATFIASNAISISSVGTFSCYVKSANTGNNDFGFYKGAGSIPSPFTATNEWQRFELDVDSSTINMAIINGGDTFASDIYIWGAQAEALSYATSYIPTAGSTATRAQETCTGAGSASTFNSTEGVLYAEIAALADDSTNRHITLSDGSDNNRLVLKYDNQSNVIQAFNRVGGVETAFLSASVTDITLFSKCAVKYKVNDYALWIDGVEVATDTNATTFPSSTLNYLKFGEGGAGSNFYGRTKGVYVFNEALTDDELQQLTGPEYNSFAALAAAYNYTVI